MTADNNMMSGFYEGILIAIKMFIATSVFPIDPTLNSDIKVVVEVSF